MLNLHLYSNAELRQIIEECFEELNARYSALDSMDVATFDEEEE